MHVDWCEGDPSSECKSSFLFALTAATSDGETLSDIVVIRSSAKAPESWMDGTNSLQDGLSNIGRRYLAHYPAWTSFNGAAVLHSYHDATRYLLSPAVYDSFLAASQSHRIKQHRAFIFTQATVNDIEAANQSSVRMT